ncbi:NlpC/P60 family protein [Brevundimonas sp. SH203]|uniref:NlpC/P60 family protein n=1 Tax=Brevundimonas sp. SH203 TaxID=345167 RepID=UPI0009C812E3|nr:NlpC/P60 family protein [Brevundimonas sp. SH203]GAW41250.1 NlpC/P60 family protein [Brevundimonas sp. SH203]
MTSPSPRGGGWSSRRRDRAGAAEPSKPGRWAAPTPSLRDDPPPQGEGEVCAVVAAARAWLGTPYRHQASVRGAGADCLGLVRGVWREVVGEEPEVLPAYSADWAEVGGRETLLEAAGRWMRPVAVAAMRPGDVLLFRMSPGAAVKHCAILSADDGPEPRMIHAYWGRAVVESWMGTWWRRRLVAVFRFPILPGEAGEGDRAKRGGGGESPTAFLETGSEVGGAVAPSTTSWSPSPVNGGGSLEA